MSDKILIGGENVEGNVTSCKIENQLKSVEKNSAFSIQQKKEYMTYDVCNKKVIDEYSVPAFTGFSIFFAVTIFVIIIMSLYAAANR